MDKDMIVKSILDRSIPIPECGCLVFEGADNGDGYGVIGNNGGTRYVHRIIYQEFVGKIPEGMQVDHTCRVRLCVNHNHLEAVTAAENTRRMFAAVGHHNKKKTHCKRGHEYSKENTRVNGEGSRVCIKCNIDACRSHRNANQN